jgi:hypothetical protein
VHIELRMSRRYDNGTLIDTSEDIAVELYTASSCLINRIQQKIII